MPVTPSSSGHTLLGAHPRQRWARYFTLLVTALLVLTGLGHAPLSGHAATPVYGPTAHRLAAAQQQPLPGSFAPAACPIGPLEGWTVDCGYLTVAESRQPFNGKTIQLAVATIRSSNPNPATDPVFFLAGGPGQEALTLIPLLVQFFTPILEQRDIVVIDQRGTGFSRPALQCNLAELMAGINPIVLTQERDRPVVLDQSVAALLACGEQLRAAGIDLRAYNSVENAADLEDLRVALGYEQINLYGASYGTRLALTAMRYRPDTLRSVVLDSTYPLQANFHTGVFRSYNQALTRLFTDCAADPACNRAYPNLEQTFDTLITRLNATPAQIPIRKPGTGELISYIPFTGNDLVAIVFQLFYSSQVIPNLPYLITQTAQGDYAIISSLVSILLQSESPISLGMQIAVQCNEDATFASPENFVAARHQNQRTSPLAFSFLFNEALLEVCAAWGLTDPAPQENQPVRSAVPTLIFAGTYDPITPPQNAERTAETLDNSFIVNYPRGGHSPSAASACLITITAQFLSNPFQPPDSACVNQEAPQPFMVVE